MDNVERRSDKGVSSEGLLKSKTLFSRDANYLRDVALFWPFVIASIAAVSWIPSPSARQLGIRCAVLALVALLLSKERLLIFLVALGFCAIQAVLNLIVHPWSWTMFAVAALAGVPFLVANRVWRKPKLAYKLPTDFGAIDMLLSFASVCATLFLFYLAARK
jgi:hypothetical protein